MTYRYLTFDCYGTLIDWRRGIEESLRGILSGKVKVTGPDLMAEYTKAEKSEEQEYKKYREVLRNTALRLRAPLDVEITEVQADQFASSVPKWPAFGDTAEFLHTMGKKGFERYILSNVDNDLLEETIANWGLEIEGHVTAEDLGSYKPHPAHWRKFMERTGASEPEILHVAQSIFHDIVPTRKLGIASAWVNRYGERMPETISPNLVSDSLRGLTDILDSAQDKK